MNCSRMKAEACVADWLRKVAGPKTTRVAPSALISLADLGERRLALGNLAGGALPARQASSRSSWASSWGEDELLQIALGENDDRVVAEAVAELLGAREGAGAVVDELVGAGVGRKAQRADDPDDRDHRDHSRHRLGRVGYRPLADPAEEPPHGRSFTG